MSEGIILSHPMNSHESAKVAPGIHFFMYLFRARKNLAPCPREGWSRSKKGVEKTSRPPTRSTLTLATPRPGRDKCSKTWCLKKEDTQQTLVFLLSSPGAPQVLDWFGVRRWAPVAATARTTLSVELLNTAKYIFSSVVKDTININSRCRS